MSYLHLRSATVVLLDIFWSAQMQPVLWLYPWLMSSQWVGHPSVWTCWDTTDFSTKMMRIKIPVLKKFSSIFPQCFKLSLSHFRTKAKLSSSLLHHHVYGVIVFNNSYMMSECTPSLCHWPEMQSAADISSKQQVIWVSEAVSCRWRHSPSVSTAVRLLSLTWHYHY